jgi:hypothetical protein
MAAGAQKQRHDADLAAAGLDQRIGAAVQVGGHQLQKRQFDAHVGMQRLDARGHRMERRRPQRIARAMAEQQDALAHRNRTSHANAASEIAR